MMTERRICYGCMREQKKDSNFCPYCGFNYSKYMETANASALQPGTLLNGKYLVGKVLGAGGFGITYLGFDTLLRRKLAIKEYFPTDNATRRMTEEDGRLITVRSTQNREAFEAGLQNFLDEARTLGNMSRREKAGVVDVTDFFHENGTGYIVMEYLPGPTLKELVREKHYRPDEKEFMERIEPVLHSLEMIHEQGLLHRDISPDNIMLDDAGKLILIDFGASRHVATDKSLTVILKHGFAPIEQYAADGHQGPWTDVYAMCATFYYVFSGKVPQGAADRLIEDRLKSLSFLNPSLSPAFSDVIMRGMSLRADGRYRTMSELKRALERATSGGGYDPPIGKRSVIPPAPPAPPIYDPPPEKEDKDVYKWAAIGITALCCLLLLVLGTFFVRNVILRGKGSTEASTGKTGETTEVAGGEAGTGEVAGKDAGEGGESTDAGIGEDTGKGLTGQADPDAPDGSQRTYMTKKYSDEFAIRFYKNATGSEEVDFNPRGTDVGGWLPEGVFVAGLKREGSRLKVYYGGKTGWVEAEHLIRYSEDAYYIYNESLVKEILFQAHDGNGIKVHTEASAESPYALGGERINYGTELELLGIEKGFAWIKYHGVECYIDMHFVRTYAGRRSQWKVDMTGKADSIAVRKSRNEDSTKIGKIRDGKTITIEEFRNGWGKVKVDGKTGWVMLYYCLPKAD